MVEAARAAPAVRAAVDARVAVLVLHARELARRQVERLVPADLDERVLARGRRRPRPPASRAARPGAGCGPRGSARAACRCRSATGRGRRRPDAAQRPRLRAPRRRSCPSAWTSACDGVRWPITSRSAGEAAWYPRRRAPNVSRRRRLEQCADRPTAHDSRAMRGPGRLPALAFALLAALPASVAQAKIKPLPRPAGIAAKPQAPRGPSLIAPVVRPATPPTVRTVRPQIASAPTATPQGTTHAQRQVHVQRQVFLPATSEGGRRPPSLVLSLGGREAPAVAGLMPTPLELVRAGETLPDYRSGRTGRSARWRCWPRARRSCWAASCAAAATCARASPSSGLDSSSPPGCDGSVSVRRDS